MNCPSLHFILGHMLNFVLSVQALNQCVWQMSDMVVQESCCHNHTPTHPPKVLANTVGCPERCSCEAACLNRRVSNPADVSEPSVPESVLEVFLLVVDVAPMLYGIAEILTSMDIAQLLDNNTITKLTHAHWRSLSVFRLHCSVLTMMFMTIWRAQHNRSETCPHECNTHRKIATSRRLSDAGLTVCDASFHRYCGFIPLPNT